MTETEFIDELKKIGINLTEEQLAKFRIYADYLIEYNQHTNLTAIRTLKGIYLKHFYDSILGVKHFDFDKKKILDIGSGAGFPGVPLKILYPDITLTVLDSNGKKTKFLELLKEKLNIEYTVINDRAEKYILDSRESFDVVTSRAVTALPVLAEISMPFVKVGGYFVPYKGTLENELDNGMYAINVLGGEIKEIKYDELPFENSERSFLIVEKKRKTESQYPRVFDKIMKKPLQKCE